MGLESQSFFSVLFIGQDNDSMLFLIYPKIPEPDRNLMKDANHSLGHSPGLQ